MPSVEELDEFADNYFNYRPKTEKNQQELLDEFNATPLFMSDAPSDAQISENPTLSAIQSLIYDSPPEEIAVNFKNHGNEAFSEKSSGGYRNAVEFYTKGLEQNFSDNKLRSILLANRAAANLELGNYRKANSDCMEAIKFDSHNIKAYFRIAKSNFLLDKITDALEYIEKGLVMDSTNKDLILLRQQALARQAHVEKKQLMQQQAKDQAKESALELSQKIKERRVQLTGDIVDAPYTVNYDRNTDSLNWPVLILYPEFKQSDLIRNFNENDAFEMHIAEILQDNLPWDSTGDYSPETVELYFETSATPPRLVKFQPSMPLGRVLSHPKLVVKNGIVNIIMISKTSEFKQNWLKLYNK